jgi:hypothetical protein
VINCVIYEVYALYKEVCMRVHEVVLTPDGITTIWHNALAPLKDEHLYRVYHEDLGEYEYFFVKNGKKVTLTTSKDRKKNTKIYKYLRMLNKSSAKKSGKRVVGTTNTVLTFAGDHELVAVE